MDSKIAVIGGGLVGSLWAVLLRKRGYDVTLFEKRPDLRRAAVSDARSINLVITSRGLRGLQLAGLLEGALQLSVPIFGRMIHSVTGELSYQPYGKSDECNFSISRTALNCFLLDAAEKAGVKIEFEHSLQRADFTVRRLHFESPQGNVETSYDLLFGTDGTGSRVRKNLCKSFPTQFQEEITWLDADYKELFMPSAPGGVYRLEKNALHIWPRGSHMMMALANLDGSFTMTVYMPQTGHEVSFDQMKTSADIDKLFESEFIDAVNLMPQYRGDFLGNPQGRLGTVRCTRWVYRDSVALMGDAAHGIVPFFGQGMNSGFEDCVVFLRALDESGGDWGRALQKFESIQKPNAEAIAEMAIDNWTEMRDRVGDARFLLKKKVEALLEKEFPELFKSRYGMVTYTTIPYAVAREAGRLQDEVLVHLLEGVDQPEQVSLERAKQKLSETLAPFIARHALDLRTDELVSRARAASNP